MTDWVVERRRAAGAVAAGLVGLTEQAATAQAVAAGLTLRVVRRDGVGLPVRLDLRPGRLDVDVVDGAVSSVRVE